MIKEEEIKEINKLLEELEEIRYKYSRKEYRTEKRKLLKILKQLGGK